MMPTYDTCYYDSGGKCGAPHFMKCSHKAPDGACLADDEDLLTYEDYLQSLATTRRDENDR